MRILLVAEHDNTTLRPSTRNALTAARHIGGEIHLLVAGSSCAAVADQASTLAGVNKVLLAEAFHLADQMPENLASLVTRLAGTDEGYGHIFAPASTQGRNFMPRVAALLGVAQISDIVAVEASDTFLRPIYAGNVLEKVQSADRVKVITVRSTAFAAEDSGNSAPIEALAAGPDLNQSRLITRTMTPLTRPELTTARVVVSGGRGLGSSENFHTLLEPLADRLGAAIGATRAAVDAGFVANDCQVGQTGKIVAPKLYIAIGISGAIQHLAGMKDSAVIVAINKDPEAPIFQVADYGLVADLFSAVPELTAALEDLRQEKPGIP